MKKLLYILSISLGAFSLTSCEKKMDEVDVTKNAYLLDRAFQITDIRFTENKYAEFPVYSDVFTPLEPCQKDDYYIFHKDGVVGYSDYFMKCSASTPDTEYMHYLVSDNDSYITIYTNPDDMGASAKLMGKMETLSIDKFTVTHEYWNEATELTEEIIYTLEKIIPTDI